MNYNVIIKNIVTVGIVWVTDHSWMAHMPSSLHSPFTKCQLKVRACWPHHSCMREPPLWKSPVKFYVCPEQCNLPSQSQEPGEVLSTAERNVEMCSTGSGIALGRHYVWCSVEENGGKVCWENHWNVLSVGACNCFFGQELSFRTAPAPSKLLHMRNYHLS